MREHRCAVENRNGLRDTTNDRPCMQNENAVISREEIYQLVWSKPMTKVSEQFEVSGSYMARVCTMLNVPRPERGYWAKLAAGKAPPPALLPEARPGDQLYWSRESELRSPPKPPQSVQRRTDVPTKVPRKGTHELIRGARKHFERSRSVDEGAYLKPYKQLLVDITTSEACLDKALEFANDLFNAFESAGHRVVIAPPQDRLARASIDEREVRKKPRDRYYQNRLWSPYRPTVVYIEGVAIGLALIEMSEEVELRYVNGKYVREADYIPRKSSRRHIDFTWTTTKDLPSGRLRLVAYSPNAGVKWANTWQETGKVSLHTAIRTIVKTLENASSGLVAELAEATRKAEVEWQELQAAIERRRKEDERRRIEQSVQASREHLGQVIQQWSEVESTERFLAGVENRAGELPDTDKALVLERLKLARDFLGTQDPLDFFLSWKTPEERR